MRKKTLIIAMAVILGSAAGAGNSVVSYAAESSADTAALEITDVPEDTRNEIRDLLMDYSGSDEKKQKKIKKKLNKEDAGAVKAVMFDYAADMYFQPGEVEEIAKLYQELFDGDEYCKVWHSVETDCTRKEYYEKQLRDIDGKYSSESSKQATTGYFNISHKLDTKYEDGLEGTLSKFADYIDPDNTYNYAAYDPNGQECIVVSDTAFEYSGNQEIAYYTDGETRTVYTEDGFERQVPVYIRVDMNTLDQRNQDAIDEQSIKQEAFRTEYKIRYKLEGKTTADIFQGDYVFPASDRRELTSDDIGLADVTDNIIQAGINEIYARHGRIFTTPEWSEYFAGKKWYHGTIEPDNFTDDMLSETERKNIDFLSAQLGTSDMGQDDVNAEAQAESEDYAQTEPDVYGETDGTICYVVNCNESITLREEPDVSAAEICQIPLGAAVEAIQGAPNGFIQVSYQGMTGFCLGSYLSGME